MSEVMQVKVSEIKVGEHEQRAEKNDNDIAGLAVSIRRVGIIEPLIVRRQDSRFLLVAGHRRLQAAKEAGLKIVPCLAWDSSDVQDSEVVFAENFFRKDLSPVEQASAIADCFEQERMTVEELASAFHRTPYWIQHQIAMLDWPSDVLEAVHLKLLSVSSAANLAQVTDEVYRDFLMRNAVDSGATARATAAWLQAWRSMQPAEAAVQAEPIPQGVVPVPAVPQSPCLCCGMVHPVNEMSHVPICTRCIGTLRSVGGG